MSEMDDPSRTLIVALLGRGHAQRYRESASFHAAIDSLASMLPAMVNGLADACEIADQATAQRIEILKNRPVDPEVFRDLFCSLGVRCMIPNCPTHG